MDNITVCQIIAVVQGGSIIEMLKEYTFKELEQALTKHHFMNN